MPKYQKFIMAGFFSSFAVKTPMWPVHTWLPDAHVEAPTAGSVSSCCNITKNGRLWFYKIFCWFISSCF